MRRFWTAPFFLLLCLGLALPAHAAEDTLKKRASSSNTLMARERQAELDNLDKDNTAADTGRPEKNAGESGTSAPTGRRAKKKPDSKKQSAEKEASIIQKGPNQNEEKTPAKDLVVIPTDAVELWSGEFERGQVRLYLWPDHFFVLLLGGEKPRSLTGLWRQSMDGVRLDLFNAQDLSIGISRGKKRIYASFGDLDWGSGELLQTRMTGYPVFQTAGKLDSAGFQDAASGKVFPVKPEAIADLDLENPIFATVQISDGMAAKILSHSSHFPRTLESMGEKDSEVMDKTTFRDNAMARHWRLPSLPGAEQAILLFFPTREAGVGAEEEIYGDVEISGPGIRAEGKFRLVGKSLSIDLNEDSLRNLEAVGAPELGRLMNGVFTWSIHGAYLALDRNGTTLRLLAQ